MKKSRKILFKVTHIHSGKTYLVKETGFRRALLRVARYYLNNLAKTPLGKGVCLNVIWGNRTAGISTWVLISERENKYLTSGRRELRIFDNGKPDRMANVRQLK